ncbi:SOSS complex subunit C-like [Clytia hemisphaerica]|uniref:SOSS complex subunit C-like n=1 Tax=Clytia hemisphaerica TaxID=252671 RepID=UPI0034D41EDE|eukprot:TCONS_00014361-protein
MSYHPPNLGSDLRNRQNILQDLQQQKQQLLQGGSSSTTMLPPSSSGATMTHQMLGRPPVKHDMTTMPLNRRGALEYASAHSSGYFIASDSTVGNPILPVIPRVDDKVA